MGPSPGTDAERGIRYAIVAVFVLGIRRRNPGAVVNAIFSVLGTYVPDVIERTFDVEFTSWQRLYVGTAMIAHAVGMLGPYDDLRWWDSLTHTLSASVIGGIAFVSAKRSGRNPRPAVVGSVVGLGILWEFTEYLIHATANRLGLDPVLVVYSREDTYQDFIFNLVGALIVLALGDRLLQNLLQSKDRR